MTLVRNRDLRSDQTLRDSLLELASTQDSAAVLEFFGTGADGLSPEQVADSRETYGANVVSHKDANTVWHRAKKAVLNLFVPILALLAVVSWVTDVSLAAPGQADWSKVVVLSVMIAWSVVMRFVQEAKSANAAAELLAMVRSTCDVVRADGEREVDFADVVAGDLVRLAAGDMVPADLRVIESKDLFVNEASLTGESEPVEKRAADRSLAHMGSTVVSGSGVGVVYATGNDTMLGHMAKDMSVKPPKTSFERGLDGVSRVLLGFMAVMVPLVFLVNGLTKGDWLSALLFAASIAVGLTPEMLPTIVTTCLAKGSVALSRKKVIVKNLDSMQNLGSIDVLCTDKTGTLTQDQVVLERYLDVMGNDDPRVLRHAFLNSHFQTGLKNLMDKAIVARAGQPGSGVDAAGIAATYEKVDEIPFDFERRRMSVVVADASGKTQMITKGAVEEMLGICSHVELDGEVLPLGEGLRERVLAEAERLNDEGMRVLAVAQRTDPSAVGAFGVADEDDMVLIGYLAFLDPPKESAAAALEALARHGVAVKVLTGDNGRVASRICREVGIEVGRVVLGEDVERMGDDELARVAERENVFAKLSPSQKARVVTVLRERGHAVGFMGDGINDAAALRVADAGISVDTAVDVAKETASVVLLEKDLMVLETGIVEGRRTYANTIKYLKMTASSNFGNMFSVLAASVALPFLPMGAIQLILLDMVYNFTCFAVPWDNVDPEMLDRPTVWDARSVAGFMLWMGPVSSLFDIATFAVLFFVVCPAVLGGPFWALDPAGRLAFAALFQTGWCVESMWTQTLVVHMIRTEKAPFLQSRASAPLMLAGVAGCVAMTVLPWTPAGAAFGLSAALPAWFFAILAAFVVAYMLLATLVKRLYVRRYGKLL